MSFPWPPGAAAGIGSLPGTDPLEAVTLAFGELPDLPHLPELPARGPGADLIGRTAALLVDLPVEIVPTGWRIAGRPGRDLRRARDFLAIDLDALEQAAEHWTGPLKLQACGPWTLAAGIELPSGHRVLTDAGAVRDLADVQLRVPGASVVLQLDEPTLPAVLAAALPTASGYGTVRAIGAPVAEQGLRDVLAVAPEGSRVVHCCAADAPISLLRAAGADAISVDAALLASGALDDVGAAIDGGASLWLGVVPGTDAPVDHRAGSDAVWRIWRTLGFADTEAAARVVPTPACGLAGASPRYAREALTVVRDVGRDLLDAS
jgi:hypothetical protein